jgi:KDO2-lipid IV(A) lauroyltransferase
MKYRLKHIVEYAALRGVAGVVRVLPYRAALGVGWVLAVIGFHGVRFRRREAERRIRDVFGDRFSDREVRRIAWLSLRNLIFTAVDIIRTPFTTTESIARMSDYNEIARVLEANRATGRGAICALPHMGAWELPGRAMLLRGLPFFSVAGKQRNPLFDQYLNATREQGGMPITMRGSSTLRTIITRLKAGGILALLPDVRMRTEAVSVAFLGKQANIAVGMASFARHAGVPIYPVIMTRVGWARHVGKIHAPILSDPSLDKPADIQHMTQQVMDVVTQAIYDDPGQWFWYNKRWVLEPVE